VRRCEHLKVADLSADHARCEGKPDVNATRAELAEIYPGLADDDAITFVEFDVIFPTEDIHVRYENISPDHFDAALQELERDFGWASWTTDLHAIWQALPSLDAATMHDRVPVSTQDPDPESGRVTVSFPGTFLDWSYNAIPSFFALIAGDVLGAPNMGRKAVVASCTLPKSVKAHFLGPRLGITGLRSLLNVHDRPIVAYSVKPRFGLSTPEFATICKIASQSGIDIIEDDERMSNQPRSRLIDRAKAALDATAGTHTIYSANITGRADHIVKVADQLIDIGVQCLKIDVLPAGFAALQGVSELIHHRGSNVAITVYPAMKTLYERGMPRSLILELCRLCGADVVYAGVPPIPESGRHHDPAPFQQAASHHAALKRSSELHNPVLPTISTSITPLNIGAYTQIAGPNVGFFVGGGIPAYRGTLADACTLIMRALRDPEFAKNMKADEQQILEESFGGNRVLDSEAFPDQAWGAFEQARSI